MRFASYAVSAVSCFGSLISLWAGLYGKGPGPQWVWIVVAYIAVAFAGLALWWGDRRLANIGKSLEQGLKKRYETVVVEWAELDNLYQQSNKDPHAPKTLPDPMGSKQIGDSDFRYRIGVLQTKTYAMLADFSRIGIRVDYKPDEIRSVAALLKMLERCRH